MYREGHIGAALLVYAPVGLLVAVQTSIGVAILGGFVTVGLATLPDVDQFLRGVEHRGITHTVYFAVVVGLFVGILGAALSGPFGTVLASLPGPVLFDNFGAPTGPPSGANEGQTAVVFGVFGFVVGAGTILSHIAVDALTPMGVDPFGNGQRYSLGVVKARNRSANYTLLALGLGANLATVGLVVSLDVLS